MANLTRREAIGIVGVGVLLLSAECLPSANAAPAQSAVRPPGAPVSEKEFLARCIRCQKCIDACDTRVIETMSLGSSLKGAFTPVLNFDYSWCNLCGRCWQVCPTGALSAGRIQESSPKVPAIAEVDRASCIAWSWSGCTICFDECPEEAIELGEHGGPYVLDDKCTGCGLCQLKCPNASVRSFSDGNKQKGIVVLSRESKGKGGVS